MPSFHLSTFISAPREKVWDIMLSDTGYRAWTKPFNADSYYKGNWEQGSKMLFLGTNPEGKGEGGMVSRIETNRPYEFISIEHLGMIKDGVEDTESEAIQPWAGVHENYTFNEKDGGTELVIDMDIQETEKAWMEEAWKKALEKLKELVETQ